MAAAINLMDFYVDENGFLKVKPKESDSVTLSRAGY